MKATFTSLIVVIVCNSLFAQPGTLDVNFGDSGKVISTNYQGESYASLIQPDGKIVVGGAGSYYKGTALLRGTLLARYNTDGNPDLNFADSGRGVYILGDSNDYFPTIRSMALQPDGKIVALGTQVVRNGFWGAFSLLRFNTDGSPDDNFGINGLVVCNITGGLDAAYKVRLLKDGRIVVAGQPHKDINDHGRGFIACYNQQGNFDRSFGDTGVVITSSDNPANINCMAITADDKIIIGGTYRTSSPIYEYLFQYNNNGTPDLTFGENGIATMPFSNQAEGVILNDIAIDKEGRIATCGAYYSYENINAAIEVGRFTKAGFPDTDFSSDGYTYTQYSEGSADATTIAVQANGKILAAGVYNVGDSGTFTMIRYNTDGSVDSTFGINGIENTFFYGQDEAYSANIQNDGKIVLAGYSQLARTSFVDIARYNGDLNQKQILITKIRKWIQHHNGFTWDANSSISSYTVQRSGDGMKWSTVNGQQSIANSRQLTVKSYYYNDPSPLSGTNYYRLQTTSISGAVTNSNVIAVISDDNTIKISPNPASNNLHIEGLSPNTKLTVVDFAGNIKLQTQAQNSSYNLNIASLKAGNYLLKIETKDDVVTKSFVKE